MNKIKIAQMGLGPIGVEAVKLAATKDWAEISGGIDIDPEKQGKTLKELTGDTSLGQARVYGSMEELLEEAKPDVIIHSAGSKFSDFTGHVEPAVKRGVHVVSSCEELIYPYLPEPQGARDFDRMCRDHGANVLGTGVNPGFVMDVLPVCLTGVSCNVKSIFVEREVDASTRRQPLQKKVGSGMEPDAFRDLYKQGKAGHAGFKESLALIAHSLGLGTDGITETCEPIVAGQTITSDYFRVEPGQTRGLHQVANIQNNGVSVELDLKMYLDADNPRDVIYISGEPDLSFTATKGVSGDYATVAALVNSIPRLVEAEQPGLKLMTDLPVPTVT